jgi:multidrug resistance protein, MATE family
MTDLDRPRRPIVELLSLALPTVAQMASYTFMQFIDMWILSRLGPDIATAASNSGILVFSTIALGMGVLILVNTLVSQSYGRKDFHECGRYLWQGIWIGLIYGLALMSLGRLGLPIFRAFGHPPDQVAMENTYWRIVFLAAAVKLVSTAAGQFLLGIDRPRAVLAAALVGVSINAVAAWAFVLGHLGFQSWGIAGAAWAQNLGVTCELLTLLFFVFRSPRQFGAFDISPRLSSLKTLIHVGAPSGLQWFSDLLAWGIFCNGVIGVLGPAAMAANSFMLRYLVVSFMPAIGISTAVTALVGRYIGRNQPEVAARRAHLGFFITLIYVALCGIVFITQRGPLIRLFAPHDPQVIRIGGLYLIYAAIYELFDAMYIVYSGALRGAGDTLVPAIVMTTLCWVISILGGWIVARWVPSWGYGGPWIMGCLYGASVGLFMVHRFLGGRWKQIRLGSASNVELASATLGAP